MRHTLYIITLALLVASCSGDKKSFLISGKFRGLDQSEFICYSESPAWGTLDTIRVSRGAFRLQHSLTDTAILVLQYPNFMRTEVIAVPGGKIKVKGDANNMLNIRVTGDSENEALTRFRRSIINKKGDDILRTADAFIRDNPDSWASIAVLNRYFLQAEHPDYARISRLLALMLKAKPSRTILRTYQAQLSPLLKCGVGAKLPAFTTKDLNGATISNKTFLGRPLLITFWASFAPENLNLLRDQRRILRSLSYSPNSSSPTGNIPPLTTSANPNKANASPATAETHSNMAKNAPATAETRSGGANTQSGETNAYAGKTNYSSAAANTHSKMAKNAPATGNARSGGRNTYAGMTRNRSLAVNVLNICVDADSAACHQVVRRDSILGYNVCDCLCFNSPLVLRMGVRQVPANILVDANGIIRARDISVKDLPAALAKIGVK